MAKDKDEDEKKRPPRTGSVAPEDEELTLWLNRLWARGELPDRLEVWQMFGRNKAVRGEMIHHEDFTYGKKLDVEEVNRVANEIMATCQHDCDSQRREAWYQLAIIDSNRRSSPLTRRIGALNPQRQYALSKQGEIAALDEDEEVSSPQAITLKYVQEGLEQQRWDKQRNDRVLGEVLMLLVSELREVRGDRNNLMTQQMSFFGQLQDSLDRAEDRKTARERENFKISMWKDGMRTARNLLPGLFAGTNGGGGGGNGGGDGGQRSNGEEHNPQKINHGSSQERTLIDNFLTDVEENEELHIALFGDFEERDGKLVQVKPGIFSLKQFGILSGIREGRFSADDVDVLMPGSTDKRAITEDQIKHAMAAGVTDGIGSAIFELVGLRQKRKMEREQQQTPAANEAE